jgi:hypothetical protein
MANIKHLHTLGTNCDIICQHRHHVIAEVNFSQPVRHPGRAGEGVASHKRDLVMPQVHLTDRQIY